MVVTEAWVVKLESFLYSTHIRLVTLNTKLNKSKRIAGARVMVRLSSLVRAICR